MKIRLIHLLKVYFQAFVSSGSDTEDPKYRLGVGIMLVNREKKIFVGKRKQNSHTGWQMPQGGVDFYGGEAESFSDAAWRELWEEVGATKEQCVLLTHTKNKYRYNFPTLKGISRIWKLKFKGQKQVWYAFAFLGQDAEINLNATVHPEFSSWKWVDSEELITLCVPFKRSIYKGVLEELWPYVDAFFMKSEKSL